MKPPIRWAAGLYPARWRERYGAEFAALLDEMRPRWRDFFDILRGAILMQLKLPGSGKTVAWLAAAGLIVAAVVAFRTDDRWVSTAVIEIQPQNAGDHRAVLNKLNEAQQEILSRHSLGQIIVAEDIYKKERTTDPLEDIIQNMRNHALMIRMVPRADKREQTREAFTVSFEYPDRFKARAVARDVTMAFEQQVSGAGGPSVQLLDPPSLPQAPAGPNRALIITLGLAFGLAAGVALLGIRRWPLIAVCGAVAAVLAWACSLLVATRYVSTAVLSVPGQDAALLVSESLTNRDYLASLIDKMRLYVPERNKQHLDHIVERMRDRDLRIRALGARQGPTAIAISYMSEDSKFTAQAVARELATHALEVNAATVSPAHISMLDPASLPETPVSPKRSAWVMLGLLAGLLLGAAWTLIRHMRMPAPRHA